MACSSFWNASFLYYFWDECILWSSVYEKNDIPKKTFIKERTIRLFVPYLIGTFTYLSVLTALLRIIEGSYILQYSIFDPRNFISFYFSDYFSLENLGFILMGWHLWFLFILFIFNLVLYQYFTSKVYESKISFKIERKREAKIFKSLFIFLIPFYVIEVINPFALTGLPRAGGWDVVNFFLFFYLGFRFAFQGNLKEKLTPVPNIYLELLQGALFYLIHHEWEDFGYDMEDHATQD